MRASILFSVLLSLPIAGALAAEQNRVTYDGQCLTIDGRDTLIFSGAFHYFRCPKELWRDRFAKIKEAGCNAVETYVAWNWHEQQMPADVNDFSHVDLTDLKDWLRMAHEEFGLYTIIRPGPLKRRSRKPARSARTNSPCRPTGRSTCIWKRKR